MTAKEIKEQIETIKRVSKRINSSPKTAQAFLIKAGIHTKSGKLTKAYR